MNDTQASQPNKSHNSLRTHHCGELRISHANEQEKVRLMGWVERTRNLGGVLFLDLRDHYGITQVIVNPDSEVGQDKDLMKSLRPESVIEVHGTVIKRQGEANKNRATGEIEVVAECIRVESMAPSVLPVQVTDQAPDVGEDLRLRYRFLDLRTSRMHHNIILRSQVTKWVRDKMYDLGFLEFQTPILTASSPEGARDFLVPSRLNPGKFYALPQAPQQFKQLIMTSGFDRYFQIAPCFRDEDPRADRSPGEFYQIDIEMSFVTQDEVLDTVETLIKDLFKTFSKKPHLHEIFPKITYKEAIQEFGCDKPDLRNPLRLMNLKNTLKESSIKLFETTLNDGGSVYGIKIPGCGEQSRKFYSESEDFAKTKAKLGGLPYLIWPKGASAEDIKGSIGKVFQSDPKSRDLLIQLADLNPGDGFVFVLNQQEEIVTSAGAQMISYLGKKLDLIDKDKFAFCWIVDYPMYEKDPETGKIDFSHNPFSMPQGGLEALSSQDPLEILAYQYDLVCNGIELSSGAIRNHRQDIMKKAFEIAGYSEDILKSKFSGLWEAFSYGAPPHGGIAPGLDRILMILLEEENIREVIMFPLNQKAQDLMMNAPSEIADELLKDAHIQLVKKEKEL